MSLTGDEDSHTKAPRHEGSDDWKSRIVCAKSDEITEELERIAKDVVDSAIKIHMAIGPGLLESVYLVILEKKLKDLGYQVEREKAIPVVFEGIKFEMGFRADLIVNSCFIVELKSLEKMSPVHAKQLLTYLKLANCRLGLLINFGEEVLKNGIRRIAN
nr:GxxExxY protein [Verrucomicrobium spinosum]